MRGITLTESLARYGPDGLEDSASSLREARDYCRHLATSHYENFLVASLLLPRRLRPHFYSIYAYCRWADDLADEIGDPEESLALLDWWEAQLRECYAGRSRHPVFVALSETIRIFEIPIDPFLDLLVAFRQDQKKHRYESLEELFDYCRASANPVGRLVLHLVGCSDSRCVELSDKICTGLQLANFLQDVRRDWQQGRLYLPRDRCDALGVSESDFDRSHAPVQLRRLLAEEVERTRGLLQEGLGLVSLVPDDVKIDIELFARAGLALLDAIERIDYDVLAHRPTVSRSKAMRMLAGCWMRRQFRVLSKGT